MIAAHAHFGREPVLVMGDILERLMPPCVNRPRPDHWQQPLPHLGDVFPRPLRAALYTHESEEEENAVGRVVVMRI